MKWLKGRARKWRVCYPHSRAAAYPWASASEILVKPRNSSPKKLPETIQLPPGLTPALARSAACSYPVTV